VAPHAGVQVPSTNSQDDLSRELFSFSFSLFLFFTYHLAISFSATGAIVQLFLGGVSRPQGFGVCANGVWKVLVLTWIFIFMFLVCCNIAGPYGRVDSEYGRFPTSLAPV
jgi:NADH:ubiquinone oxidoreductase subunit H